MSRTTSERDEGSWSAATTPQMSRRDMLAERAELHPDDLLPPAAHLMPAPGVDVLAVFAAEVEVARHANECTDCGTRCGVCSDRMCATNGPAPAIRCDAHPTCVDCAEIPPCRDCGEAIRQAHEGSDW